MTFVERAAPKDRWLVFALVVCFAFFGSLAVSSSAQTQKSSLTMVSLCVTKSGPEKGGLRFVQAKLECKRGEQRVQVVSDSDQPGMLGIQESNHEPGLRGIRGPEGKEGKQGPAGPSGATGYLRIESTSPIATGSGSDPETAATTVTCPGSRKVVGGGYEVNAGSVTADNNPAEVAVTQNHATSDTAWSVSAVTDDKGAVGSWTVSAYAVCAEVGG